MALAGAAGSLLTGSVAAGIAAALAAYGLAWSAAGARRFPASRAGWQANRRIAMEARLGRVYFGAILGLGVWTQMTTPLVYALVAYATAVRLPVALLAGVGFGLGRSRPLVTGLRARGGLTPAAVAARFTNPSKCDRLVGCAVAAAMLATVLTQAEW